MPVSAYYKGSGERVRADMIKRYGKKLGTTIFYAKANKMGLRPGSLTNLRKPKKGKRSKAKYARLLAAYRAAQRRKKARA